MARDDDPPHQDVKEVEDLVLSEASDHKVSTSSETSVDVLKELQRESRDVLDHRISLLNDLDDKAMRTVRTAVLVLSIIFSAAGVVSSREGIGTIPPLPLQVSGIGVAGLFLTIVYGVVTYSDSETEFGPDVDFRLEARREGLSERQWLILLLSGYNEWISTMEQVNSKNATRLNRVQLLLILSLFCLMIALGLVAI